MPFTVKPEERVKRKKLGRAVDKVCTLFASMEEWALADGNGELAAYAHDMWLRHIALHLSLAYNDQRHLVCALLEKIEDEFLREQLRDQMDELVHIESKRVNLFTAKDGSRFEVRYFPDFLLAYFHAQDSDACDDSLAEEMLAAIEDPEEEEEELIVVEESTH